MCKTPVSGFADSSTNKAALAKAMQGHILAQRELVGLYKKTAE